MTLFLILVLCALILVSLFASASEIALFSLSTHILRSYQRSSDPYHRRIAALVLRPRELFVTLFILNIAANILVQNIASTLAGVHGSWWLKVGVPLLLIVLLGEVLPKYIALQNNVRIANAVVPMVERLSKWVRPLRALLLLLAVPLSRILFGFLKREQSIQREQLDEVLESSAQQGTLHSEEVKLVRGYLDLQDRQVKELMQPRGDILFYDLQKPLTKLLHLFSDQQCSRVPVCERDIDSVKGIISATTFFLNREKITDPTKLLPLLDQPHFVPETTPMRKLMRQFSSSGAEVGLVVDEYGSIAGLITREDMVEVVVGEISDERVETRLYTRADERTIIASGKLELRELEEIFGERLESRSNVVTLGGWLTERLGDIPKSGTKVQTDHFLFQVLAADPQRVRRIYVRYLGP